MLEQCACTSPLPLGCRRQKPSPHAELNDTIKAFHAAASLGCNVEILFICSRAGRCRGVRLFDRPCDLYIGPGLEPQQQNNNNPSCMMQMPSCRLASVSKTCPTAASRYPLLLTHKIVRIARHWRRPSVLQCRYGCTSPHC